MALSLSRPRLALILKNCDDDQAMFFFSAHQSCSFRSLSSMLITEKNTLTMPKFKARGPYNSVRGLICCCIQDWFVVCNPSTGQVIRLGKRDYDNYYSCRMYLGYDPNNDEYKVLPLMSPECGGFGSCIEHSVLTLGGQGSSHSWRPIKTNYTTHGDDYDQNGVYNDGVVYYKDKSRGKLVAASFDVGSEQLSLITTPEAFGRYQYLTDYLGKLAVYCYDYYNDSEFILWVLDDVKNEVWSNKIHVVPSFLGPYSLRSLSFSFAGITAGGEIVYVSRWYSDPFELLFYDVEKKTERRVRVEGLSDVKCYNKPTLRKMTWASLLCLYVENIIYFSGN